MKKYYIISMSEMDSHNGCIPMITTAIGHATNGTTIVGYEEGQEPDGMENPMSEEEFLDLVNNSDDWVAPA